MSVCSVNEKATVRYQFPGQEKKIYVSPQAPITVTNQWVDDLYYKFVGYRCNYSFVDVDRDTGQEYSTSLIRDTPSRNDSTLISNPERFVFPPFEYPIVDWYGETGFSQYCRFQEYSIGIRFSNSKRERVKGFFTLGGTDRRAGRPNSRCYLDFAIRDVYFVEANEEHSTLKHEIKVVNGDGSIFKDYGDKVPDIKIDCGDCGEGFFRCDTPDIYPGYSCMPCSTIVSDIQSIRKFLPNYR